MKFHRGGQVARLSVPACLAALSALAAGCAAQAPENLSQNTKLPPVGAAGPDEIVVQSRAVFTIETGNGTIASRLAPRNLLQLLLPSALAASGTQAVTVTNSASSSLTLNNQQFVIPPVSNQVLDFGSLLVSQLFDNNLNVCGGPGSSKKCTKALIRMYTTGQAGAGLYNAADQFGAPITAGLPATEPTTVGLDVAGAAVLQTLSIRNNQHVLRNTDFTPTPQYNVKADFRDAGAGAYSATIVVEYGLTNVN